MQNAECKILIRGIPEIGGEILAQKEARQGTAKDLGPQITGQMHADGQNQLTG